MASVLNLLKTAAVEWDRRGASRAGASLAFYSLLSLAPLLVVVVWICATVFDTAQLREQLLAQFQQMVGQEAARALDTVLRSAQKPGAGILANIIGSLTLLLGASGVLLELHTALNQLWDVPVRPSSSTLVGMIRERFLSFGMVLGVGFLLLISLSVSACLSLIGKYFGRFEWFQPTLWEAVNFLVSLLVIATMFALIFRWVPDVRLPWPSIWQGAALTAILFTVGKTAIGLYLGKTGVGSAYGAAGSLVVLVAWIYYSAQIFYFGAILTKLHANGIHSQQSPRKQPADIASYRTR
jgi:membrane protein